MNVRLYYTIFGIIIGEKIADHEKSIILKNAGVVHTREVGGQVELRISILFVPMVTNRKELFESFRLKKDHIIYSGKVVSPMSSAFEDYRRKASAELAGIQLVKPGSHLGGHSRVGHVDLITKK